MNQPYPAHNPQFHSFPAPPHFPLAPPPAFPPAALPAVPYFPTTSRDDSTDDAMSGSAPSLKGEESTDGEFKDSDASVSDGESDVGPKLYSHGMTERKKVSKSILPEEYDADLYLLRRSVSLSLSPSRVRELTQCDRDVVVKLGTVT